MRLKPNFLNNELDDDVFQAYSKKNMLLLFNQRFPFLMPNNKEHNYGHSRFSQRQESNLNASSMIYMVFVQVWHSFFLSKNQCWILAVIYLCINLGASKLPFWNSSCLVHYRELYWNKNQPKFLFLDFFVLPQKVFWRPLRPL